MKKIINDSDTENNIVRMDDVISLKKFPPNATETGEVFVKKRPKDSPLFLVQFMPPCVVMKKSNLKLGTITVGLTTHYN